MKKNRLTHLCMLAGLLFFLSISLQACRWSASNSSDGNATLPSSDNYYRHAKVSHCDAGEMSHAARFEVLKEFNTIRQLHGLSTLSYDEESDPMLVESALIMVANQQLSHKPEKNWRCYSDLGAQGAEQSNIGLYRSTDTSQQSIAGYERQSIKDNLIGYMTEINHVEKGNVGHRLWMLNPFLTQTAYGQASAIIAGYFVSSSALRVVYDFNQISDAAVALSTPQQIIAYPYGDYPAAYFAKGAELSFSVLVDAENYMGNVYVDYSQATVAIVGNGGRWEVPQQAIGFSPKGSTPTFAGLPNHLQFSFPALQYNREYQVVISDVNVCAQTAWIRQSRDFEVLQCQAWQWQDYSYRFKIVD